MQIAIALATCTPTQLSYVMARILTQTLLQQLFIRNSKQSPALILKSSINTHTHSRLFFSSSIEIDHLGGAASSSDGEFEALALKRLDDLIHGIIVQKSTPDWLPFVPGSSFWVPPRPNFLDLVTNLSHHHPPPPHSLSFSTSRGWPCSSTFFLLNHHEEGSAQPNEDLESKESAETEMEVDIDVKASDDTSRSENEEDWAAHHLTYWWLWLANHCRFRKRSSLADKSFSANGILYRCNYGSFGVRTCFLAPIVNPPFYLCFYFSAVCGCVDEISVSWTFK